jgi:hypothetical protein
MVFHYFPHLDSIEVGVSSIFDQTQAALVAAWVVSGWLLL